MKTYFLVIPLALALVGAGCASPASVTRPITPSPIVSTLEFTSITTQKGHTDRLRNVRVSHSADGTISNPVVITGEARLWYFEAVFPIDLFNTDGQRIEYDQARAKDDWMTEDWVPFEASISFSAQPTNKHTGKIVLRNDNPSGLEEEADAFEIPIRFPSQALTNAQADNAAKIQKFTDDSFGFSFNFPSEWKLADSDGIVFQNLGPYKADGQGDALTVRRMEGSSVTVQDAKFGDTMMYFDENKKRWMIRQPDQKSQSDYTTVEAVPAYKTLSGLPVFSSTGRWKTVIIPLSHKRFLVVNMTGSGWTDGLDPFVKTIRASTDTLKAEDASQAIQAMLDSEKPIK
ncbi:MAG: Gmad2 immunoglobulin-like domain-containing protein [Candidatus Uhrbacteria bacterium]